MLHPVNIELKLRGRILLRAAAESEGEADGEAEERKEKCFKSCGNVSNEIMR